MDKFDPKGMGRRARPEARSRGPATFVRRAQIGLAVPDVRHSGPNQAIGPTPPEQSDVTRDGPGLEIT
eukprot:762550-Hanusia_phi.AAC.8